MDRYAESVTMNGQQINTPNATETGYGIWRLTQRDIEKLIAKPAVNTRFLFKYYCFVDYDFEYISAQPAMA